MLRFQVFSGFRLRDQAFGLKVQGFKFGVWAIACKVPACTRTAARFSRFKVESGRAQ